MEQPLGFVAKGEIGRVYCLRKSLYGQKQSPCAWFGKFSEVMEKFDMQKSKSDHSVFYRNSQAGIILLFSLLSMIWQIYLHSSPFFMANSTQRTYEC